MLTCRELAHRHASDYLDGQLGWRARAGIRFHLLLCENCRRFIAQLCKVRSLLRNKPQTMSVANPAERIAQQQLAEQLVKIYEQQKKSPPPL